MKRRRGWPEANEGASRAKARQGYVTCRDDRAYLTALSPKSFETPAVAPLSANFWRTRAGSRVVSLALYICI